MLPKRTLSIANVIIILLMLLCVSGGVLRLEYPSKYSKLHQGLDYIYLFCDTLLISLL